MFGGLKHLIVNLINRAISSEMVFGLKVIRIALFVFIRTRHVAGEIRVTVK